MGINVDIYTPRLDVTFKKGPVPKARGPIPDIRLHWSAFTKTLAKTHLSNSDQVRILEMPLWQITEDVVASNSKSADKVYIPHKMKDNWFLDERVRYYMQMVIPNIFSIDKSGWCASADAFPIGPKPGQISYNIYPLLKDRIGNNLSKFSQPVTTELNLPDKFVFFPCQIPHDETIRFHSDVSVESSLLALLSSLKLNSNYSVVIKGHPANTVAMEPLKNIYESFKSNSDSNLSNRVLWIDECSVHRLIEKSKAVFTVNSGVGLEALLHAKPVYTFGNADYAYASTKITFGGNLNNAAIAVARHLDKLETINQDQIHIRSKEFIEAWYSSHFDYENSQTFLKAIDF